MKKKGLTAVALNTDSISASHEAGKDVWEECARGVYQVVLCSPEQLGSVDLNKLLANEAFQGRVGLVTVDEVHLIPGWGGDGSARAFQSAFNAIGLLKSQLGPGVVYLGLSGTLMPGKPLRIVRERLGLDDGPKFSFMKLDCERKNLHITFRRIQHTFTQGEFPNLDWLIPEKASSPADIPKTVIYVDHIMRGQALVAYLRGLLTPALQANSGTTIRHLYASTCSQCKEDALDQFTRTESCNLRIIVATEAFGCGVDVADIYRVINLGTPRSLDSLYQRFGRAARGILAGYCFAYVSPKLWDSVSALLGLLDRSKSKRARTQNDSAAADERESECCEHFKQALEAHLKKQCINYCINLLYDNPHDDKPKQCARCSGCIEDKVPSIRTPTKQDVEADDDEPQTDTPIACADSIPHVHLKGLGRPSKDMLDTVRTRLGEAIHTVWISVPAHKSRKQFGGLLAFVTASKTSVLVKLIIDLESPELGRRALGEDWRFWDTHGEALATRVLSVRKHLIAELETRRLKGQSKRRAARQKHHERDTQSNEQIDSDSSAESEDLEASRPSEAAALS